MFRSLSSLSKARTAVTAAQLRDVVERLIACGQHAQGDPEILIVCDAGYDVPRLAFVLADLPVELVGRIRADRVHRLPIPSRVPGTNGRPPKHGGEFDLKDPATWPEPAVTTMTDIQLRQSRSHRVGQPVLASAAERVVGHARSGVGSPWARQDP
jgi:hypothetical protein